MLAYISDYYTLFLYEDVIEFDTYVLKQNYDAVSLTNLLEILECRTLL